VDLSSEAKQEVQRLIASGHKLAAIKYLADTFQIDLADAKRLVEVVEVETGSAQAESLPSNPSSLPNSIDPVLRATVIALLQSNQKIEAVKKVKTSLNTGLKEALITVETIQKELDPNYQPFTQASGGCVAGTFTVISILFGLVTVFLFAVAGVIYYIQSGLIKDSELVTGKVSDFEYSERMGSAPVITYAVNGQTYEHRSTTFSSPPAYVIDEEVEVYVSRTDPHNVVVNSFEDRWLLVAIIGGIGVMFLLFTVAFFFAGRKIRT
jgi:ribosomal protein L7/L12